MSTTSARHVRRAWRGPDTGSCEGRVKNSDTVKITTFTKEKIGLEESKMYKNCNGNGM